MLKVNEQNEETHMNGNCRITINYSFAAKTQEEEDKILKEIALFYKRKLMK